MSCAKNRLLTSRSWWLSLGSYNEIMVLNYVLNCWFFGDQLSLTVDVHKLECLVKRLFCCIQGQGHSEGYELQWMFARTISLIDQTLYGDASSSVRVSFRNIILLCSRSKPQPFLVSEILKLLQSQLVWWCIITTQGKTPYKYFIAFTQGVRQRIWLGGLWTRLLPLLAIPIYKTGSIPIPIKKMWK